VFGLQAESICLWFLVWDFVRQQRGRLWLEFLPAYAPELNPVEYLWSHWKQHELPNFCPPSFTQLSLHARRADALPSEQDRIGRAINALLEEIGLTGPTGRSARKAVAPEPQEASLLPVGGWPQR
jgi:DDE superfamily endonuclease